MFRKTMSNCGKLPQACLPATVVVAALLLADGRNHSLSAAPVGAGAVVLVNSQSARYPEFQHFIQPYLDNFGFPYSVQDIATNAPGPALTNYAVIIIGHAQLDTNGTYLDPTAQAELSLAVSNGVGLVSFDNDLSVGGAPRYRFVQDIFGFGYVSNVSATVVNLPPTEPGSQMHYITARHPTNDSIRLRASMSLAGLSLTSNATAVALAGSRPLMAITHYGQGRAVQWTSYGWMTTAVLGPLEGLDDLVWRGVVWAARKPFVMRGLPNLVTMRMDDASGPFWWVHVANQMGFKPWIGFFLNSIDNTEAADLSSLVTSGQATASIHSFDCCSSFFYFNHSAETAYSDSVMSNNFAVATQWHISHNVPISKVVAPHYSEIGLNAFAGLKAWGVEYIPIEVVPGTVEYASPGAPWLIGGPYRLYETPQPGQVDWPLWYADFLSVPGHPEFEGQFFNCYVEVRDDSPCNEWCPANNDLAGSIGRGARQVKRELDSMAVGQLYTHEWYLIPIPQSSNQTPISSNNWSQILQGITNNLSAYAPNYVTMDYACEYVRATRTSRLLSATYDPALGQMTVSLFGYADLDTSFYVFTEADNTIGSTFGIVPAFSGSVTDAFAMFGTSPAPPAIFQGPSSLTNTLGASATLTVSAVGPVPLAYQWLQDLTSLSDGGNISGAASASLTFTNLTATNAGLYTVVVTNLAGSVTSPPVTLTVVTPPQFTSVAWLAGSTLQLSCEVASNLNYRIDVSTDLVNWTVLTNLSDPSGPLQLVDPAAANFPQRYYRAVWVP